MLIQSIKELQPLEREYYLSSLPLNCTTKSSVSTEFVPELSHPLEQGSSPHPLGIPEIQTHRTYKVQWRWPLGGRAAAQDVNIGVPCLCLDPSPAVSLDQFLSRFQAWFFQSLNSVTCFWVSVLGQKDDGQFSWHRFLETLRDTGLPMSSPSSLNTSQTHHVSISHPDSCPNFITPLGHSVEQRVVENSKQLH